MYLKLLVHALSNLETEEMINGHLNAFVIEDKLDAVALICVDNVVYYRPYNGLFSNDTNDKM